MDLSIHAPCSPERVFEPGPRTTIEARLQEALCPGRILEVRVGPSRTVVLAETEDGIRCGLAATLSNPSFERHCRPAVRHAGHLHEMGPAELAALIESSSYTEASIGLAAINALLPRYPDSLSDLDAEDFLIDHAAGKSVAMIGHFPFIRRLKPHVSHLWVLELNPQEGDLPARAAPHIVPQANVVAITATTLINKTFAGLVSLCRPGATVLMLGPSTPLSPILFDFGIHILSGTVIDDPRSTVLGIGQGSTLHQLHKEGSVRHVTMKKDPK